MKEFSLKVLFFFSGFHFNNCAENFTRTMEDLRELIDRNKANGLLFPPTLVPDTKHLDAKNAEFRRNGGWSDVRDIALCLEMLVDSSK